MTENDAQPDQADRAESYPPLPDPLPPPPQPPPPRAEVLAQALAEQARNAPEVEEGARLAEGVEAPRDRRLPFPIGTYDADAAFAAVETQWAICNEAERVYEDLKEQAGEARATLTKEEKTLRTLIAYHVEKRHKGERDAQLPLREIDDDLPTASSPSCQWEKDNPGQRCPICRERRPEGPWALTSREHPQHGEHGDAATERLLADLAQLQEALQARKFYILMIDLENLVDRDRDPLVAWAGSAGVLPPPLMLRACIAGAESDAGVQTCSRCGVELWTNANHGAMGIPAYPLDAFVGLDCKGDDQITDEDRARVDLEPALEQPPDQPEPARRLPTRRKAKAQP